MRSPRPLSLTRWRCERSSGERLDDIRAAIERCHSYREFLESPEFASMAYDAVLRNVVVHEYFRVNPDLIRDILAEPLAQLAAAITADSSAR